jgi:hypothetical protein
MQVRVAIAVIVDGMVVIPIPMLVLPAIVALVIMVALILVTPGMMQLAIPFIEIVATGISDDVHLRPSAAVSTRVVLLSNLPIAVNATVGPKPLIVPLADMLAVAVAGLTVILISRGWSLPQPIKNVSTPANTLMYMRLMLRLIYGWDAVSLGAQNVRNAFRLR